jgi:hypothetical protein
VERDWFWVFLGLFGQKQQQPLHTQSTHPFSLSLSLPWFQTLIIATIFSSLSMVLLLSLNSKFDLFYFDLWIFCYLIRFFFIFLISISSERCHQHAFSFALEVFSWFSFCSIIRFEDMDLVAGVKVYMIYWFMLQFHHHIILLLFCFYDYQFCWFWLILHVAL